MATYSNFKTNKITNETTLVCGGSHNSQDLCKAHFRAYCYGFMDGAAELLKGKKYTMMDGSHPLSFEISFDGNCVEYFMLLDEEGDALIKEICYK